jgi:hypothetical protein
MLAGTKPHPTFGQVIKDDEFVLNLLFSIRSVETQSQFAGKLLRLRLPPERANT